MGEPCIIALDEGTTGTRALLMDKAGRVVKQAYRRLRVYYPRSGWVEQDPEEIWESTRAVLSEMIQEATARSWDVVGMGISNQRKQLFSGIAKPANLFTQQLSGSVAELKICAENWRHKV